MGYGSDRTEIRNPYGLSASAAMPGKRTFHAIVVRPIAHIYADESSQNAHRYMVLGGIVVEEAHVERACNRLHVARSTISLDT